MQIKHNCFVTWLLLFTFSVTNAIPGKDIDKLCKETTDVAFCMRQLKADPRVAAARDLLDVLAVVTALSEKQVNDATAHLESVRGKFNGPNGRRRINYCDKNYAIALKMFQTARECIELKDYGPVFRLLYVGARAAEDCERVWYKGGPEQKSPLTLYNKNVKQLDELISILFSKGLVGK